MSDAKGKRFRVTRESMSRYIAGNKSDLWHLAHPELSPDEGDAAEPTAEDLLRELSDAGFLPECPQEVDDEDDDCDCIRHEIIRLLGGEDG